MAKINSTTFGKISGKIGNVVAVVRKDGVNYIKEYNGNPHNPRTDKQQAHRYKLGHTAKALAPFNSLFKELLGSTNGISVARSYAFRNAITGEYPNYSIDYEKLMFTFGKLQKLDNASIIISDRTITLNWSFDENFNFGDDTVSLIVFNKDTEQTILNSISKCE